MSDSDSLDYLQSDFDPNSLTVPRLRSILVNYGVNYPSTAKKAQLIQILVDQILPQKSRILKERERARRSSKGIVNADPRESIEPEDILPYPRTPRRSTRNIISRIEDEEESKNKLLFRKEKSQSPSKRMPRASSKHARVSDTEIGIDLDARKKFLRHRKSEATTLPVPAATWIKPEISNEPPALEVLKERVSSFGYDNPFQSGSSPTSGISPERRRKSSGIPKERRKTIGQAKTRKSETLQVDHEIHNPSAKHFNVPLAPNHLKAIDNIEIEPSEEFTHDEQLELDKERAAKGVYNVDPNRKKFKSTNNLRLKGPLWALMSFALCCYSLWYRQEKIAVGYCDAGRKAVPLVSLNWELPNWARILIEPGCEPCPHNAICTDGMNIQCKPDFLLKSHPLSLAGLIPLAPTCEPDGGKVRKVKAVVDRAKDELRERKAHYECGYSKDGKGTLYSSAEIDVNDLKDEVSKKRRPDISESSFNELWTSAIPEITRSEEVQVSVDGNHHRLSSTSLAYLPLLCACRRSLRNTLAENIFAIAGVMLGILSLFYTRYLIISHRKINAIIPSLVSITLSRLASQAALHQADNNFDRWISIGQLRDDILRDEHSIAKRETIWRKVRIVIETNANVRSSQKEDRNGEVSRVWEWIGALGKQSS